MTRVYVGLRWDDGEWRWLIEKVFSREDDAVAWEYEDRLNRSYEECEIE